MGTAQCSASGILHMRSDLLTALVMMVVSVLARDLPGVGPFTPDPEEPLPELRAMGFDPVAAVPVLSVLS